MNRRFRQIGIVGVGVLVALAGMLALGPFGSQAQTGSGGCQTFPQTGYTVCGRFLAYWQGHGGLAQQGYPLSNEFTEVSDLNGKPYVVQYFERAVFELHPENKPPYDVLLSQLGTFRAKAKYPAGFPTGSQVPFYEDRTDAVAMLQSYYNAINRREYQRAYSYFSGAPNPPPSLAPPYDQFVQGYADTRAVQLIVGPPMVQGAAGSLYASIPAVIVATHTDGSLHTFYGCYVARRVNSGISPNPDDELWRINSAKLAVAPANTSITTLLAQGCPP